MYVPDPNLTKQTTVDGPERGPVEKGTYRWWVGKIGHVKILVLEIQAQFLPITY